MPFKKNNTLRKDGKSGIKKGQKQKKTLLKLALAERISDFDNELYDVTNEVLIDPETRFEAWKHLTKLRIPTEKNINIRTIEDFLSEQEKELE